MVILNHIGLYTGNENPSNDLISTRNEAFLLVPLLFYGITVFSLPVNQ
jgi:hypothetical protein